MRPDDFSRLCWWLMTIILRVSVLMIILLGAAPSRLRPSFHLLRSLQAVICTHVRTYLWAHIWGPSKELMHTRASPFSRACLVQHSIPLGHFRPGQAPPTFILITSWFALLTLHPLSLPPHLLLLLLPLSSLPVSDFLSQTPGNHTFAVGLFMSFCYQLYLPLTHFTSHPKPPLFPPTHRIGKLDDSVVNGRCTEAMPVKLRSF